MPTDPLLVIRPADASDAREIADIYNEAIATTTATFDTEPKSVEDREHWIAAHDERHPVLVAECAGAVVGYASLTRWSDRRAYDETAETSFYVRSTHRRQGVGRKLKEATITCARQLGFHTLIARVAEGNEASLHINQSMGFGFVGTLREVGYKFGRRLDVHILQLILNEQSGETRDECEDAPAANAAGHIA
ncbi:MAG: N-acetyltransferase [Planctomycetaceae bacterium]|nr:N-acetyltransferase [Planctomycetaceae bacterium]